MKKKMFVIIGFLLVIIMTIWMWPKIQENTKRPWIDKWDRQMQ